MSLEEMLHFIHIQMKHDCFMDLVDQTGVSETTIWKWRKEPPIKPSLHVFCKLARHYGMNPTIDELEALYE